MHKWEGKKGIFSLPVLICGNLNKVQTKNNQPQKNIATKTACQISATL